MFDEKFINNTLSDLGYKRMRRFTYKALWSTPEVEHFLYLQLYGTPNNVLTAGFGFRNLPAELFSFRSIRTYGGDLGCLIRHDQRFDCFMNFGFGRLKSPANRWSLYTPDFSDSMLAEKVRSVTEDLLLPKIQQVGRLSEFFALLITDVEPFPWVACNGAIRAAQVVAVGRQIGMEATEIHAALQPREKWIRVGSSGADEAGSYVNKLVDDWNSEDRVQDI